MKPNHKKTINYLRYKLNFTIQQAHSIMNQFGRSIDYPPIKASSNNMPYYDKIGDEIQKDWDKFIKFYATIKNNYPKNRPKQSVKRHSYNDWWQENNLNGGFAYNGVTDDF